MIIFFQNISANIMKYILERIDNFIYILTDSQYRILFENYCQSLRHKTINILTSQKTLP